ncbi:MarC family protein [Luteococcus peritonei]|uniref:UPF0056 membrane protein n=1 Tax=Luteococcus peritonei TaxID=88874 RepID=A0ABW4RVV1_9ACTN
MSVLSAATLLWLVMDPLGNVPFFMTAVKKVAPERRQWVIARELLIALVVMIGFLFAGKGLLSVLHVSPEALTAAGGVILLLIALRMVFPTPENTLEEVGLGDEPFIVPLAVPYTAGPSLLAIEILLMSQEPERWPAWLLALLLAWAGSAVILYLSGYLERILGDRVLLAMERLMGMILVMIAIQMLFSGIQEFFKL